MHSKLVAESLNELRAIDTGQNVTVVYVPLSREQGAQNFLTELIELDNLRDSMGRQLGESAPPPDLKKWAHRDAVDRVAKLPRTIDNDNIVTDADTAIVDAVWTFGELLATMNHEDVYFISESWVVRGGVLKCGAPTDPRGIAVAATGNDDQDVVDQRIDYARRSVAAKDTIAVLNMGPDGLPQCRTNVIKKDLLPNAFAIGFDGHISTDCATSFAAPRIAWLLAAVEAARRDPTPKSDWAVNLFIRVTTARRDNKIASLYFDPTLLDNQN